MKSIVIMKLQAVIIALFLFGSCQNVKEDDSFFLKGTIDNPAFEDKYIMLFTFDNDTVSKVDTAKIKNGAFYFEGKEYLEDFAVISTGNYPDKVLSYEIILNRGKIDLAIDEQGKMTYTGDGLIKDYQIYSDSIERLRRKMSDTPKDSLVLRSKNSLAYYEYSYNFKKKNLSNFIGKQLFSGEIGLFDSPYYDELCELYSNAYPDLISRNRRIGNI